MAGRGGRGSALLRALEEPVRKPGEVLQPNVQSTPTVPAAAAQQNVLPSVKPLVGGGRGSYLLRSIPASPEPVTPAVPAEPASVSCAPQLQQPPKPKPSGRGAGLLGLCGPSPPRPVREVKPLATSSVPVTQQSQDVSAPMSNLRIQSTSPTPLKSTKPKGQAGRPVQVSANYIRLQSKNDVWYQYSVAFSPNIDSRGLRFKLLYMHEDVIGKARIFDGSVLYLPIELGSKVTTLFSTNPYNNQQHSVQVTLVNTMSITSRNCITMYNVLFKRIMNKLEMVQIGKSASYDQKSAINLPALKLQIWPGYVTSVSEYEGGLLLLCDVSHRVLRQDTAYDVMRTIFNDQRIPPERKQDMVLKALIGQSVITRYNNKTYRIDDIDFNMNPRSTFDKRDGSKISYVQYYQDHYALKIGDENQPMLLSRPKQRDRQTGEKVETLLALIPELAHMTGLTDEIRQDFRKMKDIALYTRVTPQNRQIAMRKFVQSVKNNKEATEQLSMWGLSLDNDTLKTEARLFAPEKIFLGNEFVGSAGPKADWTRDATNNPVVLAVDLSNWVMVCTARDKDKAINYVNNYQKIGPQLGIQVAQPRMIFLNDDRTETYIKQIRDAVNPTVQLMVVMFPTKREDKYNAVKKLLVSERPCLSQIIVAKTVSDARKLRSVVQKISLQINAKLGGELWRLSIPLNNTMYVGIDVYHDGGKGKGRSVAGLTASMNKPSTRYYSRVCTQGPGEELIDGLKTCFIAALKNYHKVNMSLPDKIVVFRDGVGDSMLEMVSEHEVRQLQSCFQLFEQYAHSPPGLVVIIVQKRVNTRIFGIQGPGVDNPAPGTVLDHTITRRKWPDFYLVSQHVTQGTVTPTHYVIVYDNTDIKMDHLQQLSYKMCHLYYNWSGTVRVPAPCQYAHKLAYLIGENVRRDPSEALADKLYYL